MVLPCWSWRCLLERYDSDDSGSSGAQSARIQWRLRHLPRNLFERIIACAAGRRGDPCTQCEAQSCARRATLLSGAVTRRRASKSPVRLSSIRVRAANDPLPDQEGEPARGIACVELTNIR